MSPPKRDSGCYDGNLEPIAIVGMACRLGEGVNSPAAMWEAMVNRELKTSAGVPASRFNIDAYYHPGAFTRPSSIASPGGAWIDTPPEHFDPEFFGMDDEEALQTDPQHRRMLELVYECLESAGITKDAVSGTRTGVYVGNFSIDAVVKSTRQEYDRHAHATMSIDPGLVSSRISYWYNLKGPVFTINTGCTSVFFATDTACLALRAGNCDAAIIGGVNLIQSPEQSISVSKYGVMSPDSKPLPFDSNARGYLRAEGVGALYVKRLSDAIRDHDPIRGVIRCAHVNSNGAQPGLPMFTPNRASMETMVREIYSKAGLDPNETAYVEPQAIGMSFGDIAEQCGIGSAMKDTRSKDKPVLMGSLKGNFGHQEAASGVFSLIKAAMMTEAGVIPGMPHFKNYHANVDPEELKIKVQSETIPWPQGYSTRRVGVSSWGWSGTNGHILVEALDSLHPGYQHGKPRDRAGYNHSVKRPLLVTFSAHTQNALRKNIVKHQGLADKYYLADLAHTLNTRRTKFKERACVVASAGSGPEKWTPSAMIFGSAPGKDGKQPAVAFMFADPRTILGSDVSDWLKHSPAFLQTIKRMDQVLARLGSTESLTGAAQRSEMTRLVGAASQIALIDVLAKWNIKPTASLAYSGGEYLAAYSAGYISAPEVLLLLSQAASPSQALGAKAASLTEEDLAWRRPRTALLSLMGFSGALRTVVSQAASGGSLTGHQDFAPTVLDAIKLDIICEIGQSESLPEPVKALPGPLVALLGQRGRAASFSDALTAAGALYVNGYDVDLEQVNAIDDVDWKPLPLVDLPPYQWDHSRSFLLESHAMREERLCGVPYHELLGRRVHGLSPRSMIWRNPFKQDNVGWLYGAKLPTANLSAALCLSLAVEAAAQAFGSQASHGLTLRGLVFPNAFPPIKPSGTLELQTCIQSLPSGPAQESTYLVWVESVQDGCWATHCEGTVVISSVHRDHNRHNGTTVTLERITREDSDPYQLHPLTIYGCLQHAASPGKHHGSGADCWKVVKIDEFSIHGLTREEHEGAGHWTLHAVDRAEGREAQASDVELKDDAGAVACTFQGLQTTRCDEGTHEAFDARPAPRDPHALVPPFLLPLVKGSV